MACENFEGRHCAGLSAGLLTISRSVSRRPFLLLGLVLLIAVEALVLGDLRALALVDRPPGLGDGTGRFGKVVNILGHTRPLRALDSWCRAMLSIVVIVNIKVIEPT